MKPVGSQYQAGGACEAGGQAMKGLEVWEQVAEVVKQRAPAGLRSHLEAVLQLEATAVWQAYGDMSAARASLEAASSVLGLSVRLSGAAAGPPSRLPSIHCHRIVLAMT